MAKKDDTCAIGAEDVRQAGLRRQMADVKRQLTVAEASQQLGVNYQTVLSHVLKRRLVVS